MYGNRDLVRGTRIFTYVNDNENDLIDRTVARLQRLKISKDKSGFMRDVFLTFCHGLDQLSDEEILNRYKRNQSAVGRNFTHLLH